jgi:hypothetical protein
MTNIEISERLMQNLVPDRIVQNFIDNKFTDTFDCFSMFVDISGFTSTTEALMKHGQEGSENEKFYQKTKK